MKHVRRTFFRLSFCPVAAAALSCSPGSMPCILQIDMALMKSPSALVTSLAGRGPRRGRLAPHRASLLEEMGHSE